MNKKLVQIIVSFLKLGFTAFGGPAAAMAMMRQEFVTKRKWLDEDEFLDFMGISNLIPGPNATELAIHIGYKYAGWMGLILAGVCYILPAMVIVLGFAWAYDRFGSLPSLEAVLYGIKPVVVAILLSALLGMIKPQLKLSIGFGISVVVLLAYVLGVGPLPLMIGGGVLLGFFGVIKNKNEIPPSLGGFSPWLIFIGDNQATAETFSLPRLFWVFLKAGSLMYGSGYVLLAFIENDLVRDLGWLSQSQLIDAIAVGQITPGPLSTTATFVGFITGGLPGALLATLAMFLPGFVFVAITHPFLYQLRASRLGSGFLDGVIYASLGLWAGVTWEIMGAALVDPVTIGIAVLSLFLLITYDLNTSWMILGGAGVGIINLLIR